MKRLITTICSLLLFTALSAQQNKQAPIEGNGNIINRNIVVASFNALKASGVYELKLIQGAQEGVRIEADENLQDLFVVRNEGATLVIEMKEAGHNGNIHLKKGLKVHLTFKELKSLDFNTVGNISSENGLRFTSLTMNNSSVGNVNLDLTADELNIKNQSVGNINLSGKARNAVFNSSGIGNIKAGNFVVQTMEIHNTGVGHAEVNAERELKVTDSFLGKVKNKGAATMRKKNKVVI